MENNRRKFIKQFVKGAAVAGAGLWLPSSLLAQGSDVTKITILHTNDTHSHIEPFPADHPRFAGMGGVSRRKALVDSIRAKEDNVLLLDAGDIFQGTPYFNFFKGKIEFQAMSQMKYDAATIGNHDFDNTIDGLEAMLPYANFPFLSANYDFSNTVMDGKTKPYKVFEKGGIKIGVFGVGIELEALVAKSCYKETVYLDPIEAAQTYTKKLKEEEKCDLVICLSHLGYKYDREPNKISDVKLAAVTQDIDLIIGGHTHTFLKEPTVIKNAAEKEVLVTQVGFAGIQLGRVDFYFQNNSRQKLAWQGRHHNNYEIV
ncbi:metallophosphatase [Limibacter armeniacum]|uniref:bifunctional metallophosphatase/5'-nucleotidase n=1 Tax=Limibacter armeniacum TaxID=466084 RepID=UPI002FE6799B